MASDNGREINRHIENIVEAIQNRPADFFASDGLSESKRKQLRHAAMRLVTALEQPNEGMRELSFAAQRPVAARIAIEAGWLKILAEAEGPRTAHDIAAVNGHDPLLIIRLMRILTAAGYVREVGVNTYAPTPTSNGLAQPGLADGLLHWCEEALPCLTALPAWLKAHNYITPPGGDIFEAALGYSSQFDYFRDNPARGASFDRFMSVQREGRGRWTDMYPPEKLLADDEAPGPEDVLLVDVAGGWGQELQTFRAAVSDSGRLIKGRLVLEDLPQVVARLGEEQKKEIEIVEHDFFAPQPVKGAKAYYFRSILHDWNDERAGLILKNTAEAMTRGYSHVLINDIILNEMGTDIFCAGMDLGMMVMMGGMERTVKQFEELLGGAGLKIVGVYGWQETGPGGEGIIDAMLI